MTEATNTTAEADIVRTLLDFCEMGTEGSRADPLIEVMHGVAKQAADRIKELERSQLRLVRAARGLMPCYNFYDMPEDDSQRWQQLADAVLCSGVSKDD